MPFAVRPTVAGPSRASRDGLLRVWSLGEARPRDALTGKAGTHVKISGFIGSYAVERFEDGVIVFDETSGKQRSFKSARRDTVLPGFKHTLYRIPGLAQRLGPSVKDAVWAFNQQPLTIQLFEGGTLLCETKSGKINWATNGPRNPLVRPLALTQFKPAFALKQHTGPVVACAISPDGERSVSVGADSLLCEWNIKEGKLIRKFAIPASLAVAYLADGRQVLLGTSIESALIVDLEKQERVKSLVGHQGNVRAVCLAKSGKYRVYCRRRSATLAWGHGRGNRCACQNIDRTQVARPLSRHDAKRRICGLRRQRRADLFMGRGTHRWKAWGRVRAELGGPHRRV